MKLKCKFMKADEPTMNGRIYPKETLKNAIDRFKERESPMLGCYNYYGIDIPIKEVSHEVRDIWLDDNGYINADVKLFPTEWGKIISSLNEKFLSLSPVFIAKIEEDEKTVYVEDIGAMHISNYEIKE